MGSKTKHPFSPDGGIITTLCSVNTTGLVFLAARRLKVCSDITLTVQTSSLGAVHDWTVQGCVVECRTLRNAPSALRYQITLLFSELPAELRVMLSAEEKAATCSYPVFQRAPVFGLN